MEDRLLELLQAPARLEAELVHQRPPRRPVRGECVGLTARAVERDDQLSAQPLAVRLLGDERLQLRDERVVTAEREVGVDTLLDRRHPQLLQAADLRLHERLIGEIGQRPTAPEYERRA